MGFWDTSFGKSIGPAIGNVLRKTDVNQLVQGLTAPRQTNQLVQTPAQGQTIVIERTAPAPVVAKDNSMLIAGGAGFLVLLVVVVIMLKS